MGRTDLVFDRTAAVTAAIVDAVRSARGSPVRAVLELLAAPVAPGASRATSAEQLTFWRLVASSRVLQARARELGEEMQSALAEALRERGVDEADLSAALIAAAYRMVHVGAIRRILGGEAPDVVMVDRSDALARAFAAVESAIAGLGRR